MDSKVLELKKAVDMAEKIVVFGGAGFSTESGIPDFRSNDGIYNKYRDLDPESILSIETLRNDPELFYSFYTDVMLTDGAEPNVAHYYLAELEKRPGKHVTVITQNIDGLHRKAGSKNVIELHGSANDYYCVKCGEKYDAGKMDKSTFSGSPPLPRCDKCGSMVRPDVVLYKEPLDSRRLRKAEKEIETADLVIVGGTSLAVYPANMLLMYAEGAEIFVINRQRVNISRFISGKDAVFIQDSLGNVFGRLMELDRSGI